MTALVLAALLGGAAPSAPAPLADARQAAEWLLSEAPALPEPQAEPAAGAREWDGSLAAGIGHVLFGGYRVLLSSQDSISCSFTPSCSHFAEGAIDQHGFIEGILATFDRFERENVAAALYYPPDVATMRLSDPPDGYCLGCAR